MNIWDILILAAVAVMLGFAWRTFRRGRKHCPGCCADCARTCGHREPNE